MALTAPGVARAAGTGTCGPHLNDRLAAFASAQRPVRVLVAVRDMSTGANFGFLRHHRQLTASVVKVEILEALLHRRPNGLPPHLSAIATAMIDRSDNDAAQRLYERVGRARGLRQFGRLAGLQETDPAAGRGPGYAWGLTLSSPADQLRLLSLLISPNPILSDVDREYGLRLMRHVTPGQRWGATSGVAPGHQVMLKNGWLPLRNWSTDWQINSIGIVRHRGRGYLLAIESRGADSMASGIDVVDRLAAIVARRCGAA